MNNFKVFETERLIIRPTTIEDARFILELMNTPKWLANIGDRNVKTEAAALTYINEKMKPQLERLGYSNYTISRKDDNIKIGTCGLYDREGLEGIDIGFSLLPEYEKQGYAFEASQKIRDAAFNDFGIESICAITTKENIPSQRLLEKLGLLLVGTKTLPNDDEELLLYKIEKQQLRMQ